MLKHMPTRQPILKSKAGFSMVELMVTMLIFTILAAGMYALSMVGDSSWHSNKARIELQQEMRKAMEALVLDLRETGGTSITNVPADGAWYSTITFKLPTGVNSGSINWDGFSVQYSVISGQLRRIYNVTPTPITRTICQNVQSIQFRRQLANPDILEVAMQAQKNSSKGLALSYALNFDIQLRN